MVRGEKFPQSWYGSAQLRHDKLFEPVARVVVDLVTLAKVAYADGDVARTLGSSKRGGASGHALVSSLFHHIWQFSYWLFG